MKLAPLARHRRSAIPAPVLADSPIILMIDRHRRLLDATPAGSAMLERRDVLACDFGRVVARVQHDGVLLDRAIGAAADSGNAALSLQKDALRIEIVRFASQIGDARLLLLCRPRAGNGAQHVAAAAHLFGLTAAEHRLLQLLFDGMSLAGAAASLGVARTTARTHLQRIFDKTGSRRQSDLVRLVALGNAREAAPVMRASV